VRRSQGVGARVMGRGRRELFSILLQKLLSFIVADNMKNIHNYHTSNLSNFLIIIF
jgi:hypothetical protein